MSIKNGSGLKNLNFPAIAWLLLSICIYIGLFINLNYPEINGTVSHSGWDRFIHSLPSEKGSAYALTPILVIALAYLFRSTWRKRRSIRIGIALPIAALFFGFSMVVGWSFDTLGSASVLFSGKIQTLKTILAFCSWTLLAFCILAQISLVSVSSSIDSISPAQGLVGKIEKAISGHPVIFFSIILAACWLPTFIACAPGLFMGDTLDQIKMSMNLPNSRSEHTLLIDPNVTLTQHHPVLHTMLLGAFISCGSTIFGSETAGVLAYTLFQYLVTIFCLAAALAFLVEIGTHIKIVLVLLLFFSLDPIFAKYAMLITKDVLFADALLVFLIGTTRILIGKRSTHVHFACLVASAVFTSMLRSGALVLVVASLAIFCICQKKESRALAGTAGAILLLGLALQLVIFPSLSISGTNMRELMSIPFQQTARFAKAYPNEITPEERDAIDTVLSYDDLAKRYKPTTSDSVKDRSNKYATANDYVAYFSAWSSMLARHPEIYLSATLHNYYGYFYLGRPQSPHYTTVSSNKFYSKAANEGFGFQWVFQGSKFDNLRATRDNAELAFDRLPVISLLNLAAFYNWGLIILTILLLRKNSRLAVLLVPLWILLLASLIGPVNGYYFRYSYPLVICMPFIAGILFSDSGAQSLSQSTLQGQLSPPTTQIPR